MFRTSLSTSLAICLAIVLILSTGTASAALINSGCGTARIDGVLDPLEWAGAAQVPLNVDTGSGTTPGTLYIMNDNLNLYLAVAYLAPAPNEHDGVAFEFDNDNDGIGPEEGDDVLVRSTQLVTYYDGFRNSLPPCSVSTPHCIWRDTTYGGVNNGEGALTNDGVHTIFEISHELNSGDIGKDFALGPGSIVGFMAFVYVTNGGVTHITSLPGGTGGAFVYDQIRIASCPPPVLSACGSMPVIDGVVNAAEWAAAATYDMTVRTPHGGTAPARLYVMNDALNLYLGYKFIRGAGDTGNSLAFEFDNNDNGVAENGDDVILVNGSSGFFDDVRTNLPPCPAGSAPASCGPEDTVMGGTTDGAGKFTNDGVHSMYEMRHPLNSLDPNDFGLSAYAGDSVGWFLSLRIIAPPGAWPADFADTDVPGFRSYAQIKLCTPLPLAGIVTLTNAVDELKAIVNAKVIEKLHKPLRSAQENIQAGRNKQAGHDLDKFTKEARKLIGHGDLPSSDGARLIAVAEDIMRQL